MADSLTTPQFDYSQVDADTKSAMLAAEARFARFRRRHVADVLKFGEILHGIQQKLANYHDGVFVAWLDASGIATRSAYNAIKAHLAFSGFAHWQNLEVTAMYELAGNEKAKEKAITLADKGVLVTHTMAKTLVAEAGPSKKPGGGGTRKRRKKPPRQVDARVHFKEWHRALGPLLRLADRIARDVGQPNARWQQAIHDDLQHATDEIEKGLGLKPKK